MIFKTGDRRDETKIDGPAHVRGRQSFFALNGCFEQLIEVNVSGLVAR